jgi:hypothetical protein
MDYYYAYSLQHPTKQDMSNLIFLAIPEHLGLMYRLLVIVNIALFLLLYVPQAVQTTLQRFEKQNYHN